MKAKHENPHLRDDIARELQYLSNRKHHEEKYCATIQIWKEKYH